MRPPASPRCANRPPPDRPRGDGGMARGAAVDGGPTVRIVLRQMRGDPQPPHLGDEVRGVIGLVGTERDAPVSAKLLDHGDGGLPLGGADGRGEPRLDHQAAPVLHDHVPQVAQPSGPRRAPAGAELAAGTRAGLSREADRRGGRLPRRSRRTRAASVPGPHSQPGGSGAEDDRAAPAPPVSGSSTAWRSVDLPRASANLRSAAIGAENHIVISTERGSSAAR